jgi:hypothetical protein
MISISISIEERKIKKEKGKNKAQVFYFDKGKYVTNETKKFNKEVED